MHRTWLTGTALAAVLAATPALAQDDPRCDLSGAMASSETIAAIDTDANGEISREEYMTCLDANVADGERQSFVDAFDELDEDGDAVIVIADLELADGGTETATAQDAVPTKVAVTQPNAEVKVDQAAPTVSVDQANPKVAVQQAEPQVAVTQEEPKVSVSQPEPEVSVTQPEPTVEVQQDEAQVAIQQPKPQVQIDAPAPEVEVTQAKPNVTVEQHEPKVSVSQPEPEVSVETADPNVEVQSEEPKVVINQGEPEVVIEKISEADATVEDAATTEDTAAAEAAEGEMNVAANDAAPAAPTDAAATDDVVEAKETATIDIAAEELEGRTAVNNAGEEIGEIDEVVTQNASGDRYVVVSVGGFLGIGDKDIVFPMSDVSQDGETIVIDTSLTEDTLAEQEEYDESLYTEVDD